MKLAETVKIKSRDRREEWSREDRIGEVRSLDKLWFKRQDKEEKLKRKEIGEEGRGGTGIRMRSSDQEE